MSASTPSPWLRPLQVLAVALGVALAALLVAWVRMEPLAPTVAPAPVPSRPEATAADGPLVGPEVSSPTQHVAVARAEGTPEVDALAASGAVLFGSVMRADRSPVKTGFLFVYRADKHVGTASLRDGTFAFTGLQPGAHRVSSRIDDELPLEQEVALTAPTTRLDLVLATPWLLAVNIMTPEGTPLLEDLRQQLKGHSLRGLLACACTEPLAGDLPPSNNAEVTTGVGTFRGAHGLDRGAAALPKQTLGVLTLPPGEPLHIVLLLRNHVVAQMPAAPGQEEITFTLGVDAVLGKLATVRVRLIDAAGAPVTDASVALNDAQTGGGGRKVDAEGRVTLERLTPGRLDLEISHATLRAPRVRIDVAPGADLNLGDVVLAPGVPVAFDLANFEGQGFIWFYSLDPLRPGWTSSAGHVAVENGKAQSLSLYPGRYGMHATGQNGVALLEIDVRQAPPAPVRFDLRRGAALRIEYSVANGAVGLELRSEAGMLVRRRSVTTSMRESVELPEGTYTAATTDAKGATTRRTIRLTSAGALLTIP